MYALAGLAAAALAGGAAAGDGPCDIYAKGGQKCVAAHSMTRALFSSYAGPLYSLMKPDKTTKDIHAKAAGGVADAAAHDAFCGSPSACVVERICASEPSVFVCVQRALLTRTADQGQTEL